jgi:hypothetical protein
MKNRICFETVFIFAVLVAFFSCNFAPGSYPYAEKYKLRIKESELIAAIEKYKKNNPDYCVPPQTQLKDGRRDDPDDHWYHVYFYFKDENEILNTWVRQLDNETTSFAFVAINEGMQLGNWKLINKDFPRKENNLRKEKFEKRILDEIKKQIK